MLTCCRGVIAEKASDDLFIIDTEGDARVAKESRKKHKLLKADEIIAQRSAVAPVSMRKRPGCGTTDGVLEPGSKRLRTNYVTHKELTRLRNIADGRQEQSIAVTDSTYDPWDEKSDALAKLEDPRFTFLPKSREKVAPKTLNEKPVSLAASGKSIPAVPKPSGGYSYNPDVEEYVERYTAAHEAEAIAEQKRQKILEKERALAEAAAKSAREAEEAERRAELSEWEEDESAWEGFSDGEQFKLSAKRPERKTQAQRNKIKRRKEEERRSEMAANIKKKEEQASHIKKIAKEIKTRDAAKALALMRKEEESDSEESGEDVELRRRNLGKIQLPEKNLELVLPDELKESLRLLKPEGNALGERYRRVLLRGMVEARRSTPFKKQARTKTTEKWTHKDFMLH